MDDLIAFIRAQLDEDEQVARGGDERSPDMALRLDDDLCWVSVTPARVLAEVQVKRQHIAEYEAAYQAYRAALDRRARALDLNRDSTEVDRAWAVLSAWERVLKLDALPHASRPGYKEKWRP